MSNTTNHFPGWSAGQLWPWMQLAPTTLVQPIVTAGTITINGSNSTAPQTEADVLARHSYGRQIGRISDALHALILELHPTPPRTEPLRDFMEMWDEVEQVKADSARSRLDQVVADLALLNKKNPGEYQRLRSALRSALDEAG